MGLITGTISDVFTITLIVVAAPVFIIGGAGYGCYKGVKAVKKRIKRRSKIPK